MAMRNYGDTPNLRKGEIDREIAGAVGVTVADCIAPRIDERYEWEQDIRGLSETAAISELQDLIERVTESFNRQLTSALSDAVMRRDERKRTRVWEYPA